MNWDKKSIIAVFVCTVLFMIYMGYLQKKYPDYYAGNRAEEQQPAPAEDSNATTEAAATEKTNQAAPGEPKAESGEDNAEASVAALTVQDLTFETKTRIIRFDQTQGAIASIQLKDYQADLKSGQLVEVLDSPMLVHGTINPSDKTAKKGFQAKREGSTIHFSRQDGNWLITQEFTVPEDGYGMQVKFRFTNQGTAPEELNAGAFVQESLHRAVKSSSFFTLPGSTGSHFTTLVYGLDQKIHDFMLEKLCKEGGESVAFNLNNEKLHYIGIDKHYFLSFLWAKDQKLNYLLERNGLTQTMGCPISLSAWQNFGLVGAGSSVDLDFTGYFGPKQVDILASHDPDLVTSVKWGFFSFFAKPLMIVLKELHKVFQNWGLAIIVITFLLKMLFYPLTRSAAISMKKMQKLQPQMTEIREKYKSDPQKQQKELMAFMSQNKVNPFKGCLPILPQIPVFIAFYNLLSQAIELRHAPFMGWIMDLSAQDPYYITPVLLGVGMFLQQKLTPNPGMDKNQEKIMLMMPIIFALMMLTLPAGLVVYMITNTAVSIAQQQWLNRKLAKQFG